MPLLRRPFYFDEARGGYCLDCRSEIYGEPAKAVTGYLSAMEISGRRATYANCDEDRETFRSDLPS